MRTVLLLINSYSAFKQLAGRLRQAGITVLSTETGSDIKGILERNNVDVIVLEDQFNGTWSANLVIRLRQYGTMKQPVVVLTRRQAVSEDCFAKILNVPCEFVAILEAINTCQLAQA